MKTHHLTVLFLVLILLLSSCSNKAKPVKLSTPNEQTKFDPNFIPAVLIRSDEYRNDSVKFEIAEALIANLQAIIDGDKDKFDTTMLKPDKDKIFDYLFDPQVHYRFESFEIIEFVNPNKVHLLIAYSGNTTEEAVEEKIFQGNNTYFLEKNEQGTWKVLDID